MLSKIIIRMIHGVHLINIFLLINFYFSFLFLYDIVCLAFDLLEISRTIKLKTLFYYINRIKLRIKLLH